MTTQNNVLPPPTEQYPALGWLRKNLFPDWISSLITIIMLVIIVLLGRATLSWVITEADWEVIVVNARVLMTGQYPVDALWRVFLCLDILGLLLGLTWGVWMHRNTRETLVAFAVPFLLVLLPAEANTRQGFALMAAVSVLGLGIGLAWGRKQPAFFRRILMIGWLLYLPLALLLVSGWAEEGSLMGLIPTNLWGGLMLTFLLAAVGLVLSFPLGILLALGRQSSYPVIRGFCIAYIELVRAVPLITVLFMAQTMLPLLLPERAVPDRVLRAMTAFTLFTAAYMAENVRGGLQGVSNGQYEAARAVGLNPFLTMYLVILPQALRAIIPILTYSAIGGFRDTSLVIIVGLLDFLGIAKSVLAQPSYIGRHVEMYVFLATICWIFSFLMSYIGKRIEAAAGVSDS
jgi:general L-amino acid transport system permease protein